MSNEDDERRRGPREGWTQPSRMSRRGMQKRRRRDMDNHAEIEAERRAKRRATRTPKRDDVARASLHAFLRAFRPDSERAPHRALIDLRGRIVLLLVEAGYDDREAKRVLADMTIRAEYDREEWIYLRAFRRWREGGCKGPRPECRGRKGEVPRRPDGSMPWTNTRPGVPGLRKRRDRSSGDGDGEVTG